LHEVFLFSYIEVLENIINIGKNFCCRPAWCAFQIGFLDILLEGGQRLCEMVVGQILLNSFESKDFLETTAIVKCIP